MRGLGLAGRCAGQDPPDDRPVRALAAARPTSSSAVFSRARPEPPLARRHHVRLDLVRLLLHGLRHRRLFPPRSWAGGCRARCAPSSPSTRSRWRSGAGARPISRGSSTTPTGASSTSPSGTPSASPTRGRHLGRLQGDSYDNALAETVNGLYKTELIRAQGPWRTADQVELATAAWVAWWNDERLHSACGDIPPAEFEAAYHHRLQATEAA